MKSTLSENFYLDEFTLSQTAIRNSIPVVVPYDSDIYKNLKRLCVDVLQPIRDSLGAVYVSSGYRPPQVNALIGGSSTSAHVFGRAADFTVSGLTPYQVAQFIAKSDLPFDQCIYEFGRWVHVGIAADGVKPRRQLLTAYKKPLPNSSGTETAYISGIHSINDL